MIFLYFNESLREINLPNVEEIGEHFLFFNNTLMEINMPKITEIGDCFLYYNKSLKEAKKLNKSKMDYHST